MLRGTDTQTRVTSDHYIFRVVYDSTRSIIILITDVYFCVSNSDMCTGWQLHAGNLPLPGEHKTPRAENQHNRRPVRHCACVRDTAREAKDVPGAKLSDQAVVLAPADVPLWRQQVLLMLHVNWLYLVLLTSAGISCASCCTLSCNSAKWCEEVGGSFFVMGTVNLHFFVTWQIGMKFQQKTSVTVLY